MKKYNEVLKELREDNDLTQQQIADILNSMNDEEYKIYQHENMLKDRI